MEVNFEQFKACVQRFIFEKVAPTLTESADRFALGFAHGAIEKRIEEMIPQLEVFGVAKDGKVDVDALERLVEHGFKATEGGKVCFEVPSMRLALSRLMGQVSCETCPKMAFTMRDWIEFRRML